MRTQRVQNSAKRHSSRLAAAALALIAMIALGSACATSFVGPAHIQGGAAACEAKCEQQGLEFAGMVFMGEYTDGCICAKPGHEQAALDAAGNAAGGAAGVVMQMRRAQQQQQQQQSYY